VSTVLNVSGGKGLRMKPVALDLFCGAGGASAGLSDAGFDVVGIDRKLYRRDGTVRNPILFDWHELDIAGLESVDGDFDFIWASPPCQAFCTERNTKTAKTELVNLIPHARRLIEASGLPGVIENVPRAPLRPDLVLDGRMVGIPDMVRKRYFEFINCPAPFPSPQPVCEKAEQVCCLSGDSFPSRWVADREKRTKQIGGYRAFGELLADGKRAEALAWKRRVIGCDWMTWQECNNAVPRKYAELIGRHVQEELSQMQGLCE